MSVETILQAIENEIANLTQARNVLASLNGSSTKAAVISPAKGRFSATARKRMAKSQARRWRLWRLAKKAKKAKKAA